MDVQAPHLNVSGGTRGRTLFFLWCLAGVEKVLSRSFCLACLPFSLSFDWRDLGFIRTFSLGLCPSAFLDSEIFQDLGWHVQEEENNNKPVPSWPVLFPSPSRIFLCLFSIQCPRIVIELGRRKRNGTSTPSS